MIHFAYNPTTDSIIFRAEEKTPSENNSNKTHRGKSEECQRLKEFVRPGGQRKLRDQPPHGTNHLYYPGGKSEISGINLNSKSATAIELHP